MDPDLVIAAALAAKFAIPVGLAVRAHRRHMDAVAEEAAERDPHVRWARDLNAQRVAGHQSA